MPNRFTTITYAATVGWPIHAYPTWAETNKYTAGNWKKVHAPERVLGWLARYHAWRRA